MLGFLPGAELGLRNSLLYPCRLVRGLWWDKWMGLAVCCGTEQWRLLHNCFYDLLRTYHREPNGWGGVSMELLVCWPGLWSRKNLCSFVGTGSLLVHNTLKPNIKKITRSKHQFSPEIAQDFRIQEIQYFPQQLTSNIYILNTCRFNKWMGGSVSRYLCTLNVIRSNSGMVVVYLIIILIMFRHIRSQPIIVTARSKVWVRRRSLLELGGSNSPGEHGCLCLVSVVCCQVGFPVTDISLILRSPTECAVSNWVWYGIWCDTIWYGIYMIWYDMIYDMIWCDVMWCYMIWYDIWYDMIWYDMI